MKLLLFAGLRDRFGESIESPVEPPCRVADMQSALIAMDCWPAGTRLAINRRFALDDETVTPGDEVAVIPPVTGG